MYDAVWLAGLTLLDGAAAGQDVALDELKKTLIAKAAAHRGVTGDLALNANGDRAQFAYDFWKIIKKGTSFTWEQAFSTSH